MYSTYKLALYSPVLNPAVDRPFLVSMLTCQTSRLIHYRLNKSTIFTLKYDKKKKKPTFFLKKIFLSVSCHSPTQGSDDGEDEELEREWSEKWRGKVMGEGESEGSPCER